MPLTLTSDAMIASQTVYLIQCTRFSLRRLFNDSIVLPNVLEQETLQPGDHSARSMLEAAGTAAMGIALLSPDYFRKKWPMRELKVLVSRGVLLPVKYCFASHEDLVAQLQSSPYAAASLQEWAAFVQQVEHTTYVQHQGLCTERLKQVYILG